VGFLRFFHVEHVASLPLFFLMDSTVPTRRRTPIVLSHGPWFPPPLFSWLSPVPFQLFGSGKRRVPSSFLCLNPHRITRGTGCFPYSYFRPSAFIGCFLALFGVFSREQGAFPLPFSFQRGSDCSLLGMGLFPLLVLPKLFILPPLAFILERSLSFAAFWPSSFGTLSFC